MGGLILLCTVIEPWAGGGQAFWSGLVSAGLLAALNNTDRSIDGLPCNWTTVPGPL